MLSELRVRDLGVIAEVVLPLGPGLTALTGETGAGKTLVVEALELLLGGRADPTVVRAGARECLVEGTFLLDGQLPKAAEELVEVADGELELARSVPPSGRSRAFVAGRMVPVATLDEIGEELVDLYGQHAHQSLLRPAAQREALDRFCGVELAHLHELRRHKRAIEGSLAEIGGDGRARLRELDLLRFELSEIEGAAIAGVGEDDTLAEEENELALAAALREASALAHDAIAGDGQSALDRLGEASAALGRLAPLAEHDQRLKAVQADLEDLAGELRRAEERFEEDPERLAAVRARRHLLRGLVRKHGESLADVLSAAAAARQRIVELEASDAAREALEVELAAVEVRIDEEEGRVGDLRRAGAPALSGAVEERLRGLGLTRARLEVRLASSGIADDVELLLAANPGEPALPLAKVASGGELARAMLALRLVLTSAPPTLVFDEVDAGIGGEAAIAVGKALAELARDRQVLVVTHLPQVAAYAGRQFVVSKADVAGRTVTSVAEVDGEARVAELSRMLAGRSTSDAARRHAEELLAEAAAGPARRR